MAKERPLRTILVMGSQRGEGRSTTAANLAIAMAERGRSILVVDSDRVRPVLSATFSKSDGTGSNGTLPAPTHVPGLEILTASAYDRLAKASSASRAESRAPEAQRTPLMHVALESDHTIVDSPPCLESTDVFRLATEVDGVIYVVRRRSQDVSVQRRVQAQLNQLGVRILGVVFNDA
jgi:Mrp family chromosome partitioning ATPase